MSFTVYVLTAFLLLIKTWDALSERRCARSRFGDNCLYECRCLNTSHCNDVTGNCSSGCMPGWSGTACQRENVAVALPANIRTVGERAIGAIATDGDVRTCIKSTANRTGWWKLDLQVQRRVHGMRILTDGGTFRTWGIYVSRYEDLFWSPPCTTLGYDGTETYFTCDKIMSGRYIGIMNRDGPISLCEFEVFACSDYTFGDQCENRCQCSDNLEICDHVYGTCRTGCKEGWTGTDCQKACNFTYGRDCVHRCGHCKEDAACDVTSGRCVAGCAPGWDGPTCHAKCPLGYYGINCLQSCANCKLGTTCSSSDGSCVKGCAVGWKGTNCNTTCDDGEYGPDCALSCANCAVGTFCDPYTGMCPSSCLPGWEGRFCTQECLPGRYGEDCQRTCGKCLTSTCARVNGSCGEDGCLQGWSGDTCHEACNAGFYGPNCDQACGKCKGGTHCDPMNGKCSSECDPGYYGDMCNEVCSDGTWGDNCTGLCGLCYQNKGCNPETGFCDEGCFVGYYGTYCEIAAEFQDLSSALVMPVMAVSVSIVGFNLCLLFACLICKWKRDEKNIPRPGTKYRQLLLQMTHVENNVDDS